MPRIGRAIVCQAQRSRARNGTPVGKLSRVAVRSELLDLGKERAPTGGEYIADYVPVRGDLTNLSYAELPATKRTGRVKPMRVLLDFLRVGAAGALLAATAAGCARGREYELRGQVLAVDESRQEVTIRHEDIRGFMPGMTMPFKVKPGTLVRDRKPGELIRATLVVQDSDAYVRSIVSTGYAPLDGPPPPPRVTFLEAGATIPDATFVDQSGATRTLAAWRGRTLALTFIYTRCPIPDFCPRMDRQFAEVQRAVLTDASWRDTVHLISISFDPSFDTPAVLAAHARALGADPAVWTFLTGTKETITAFGAPLGVTLVPDTSHPQEIVHNLRTAVIDAEGRLVRIFSGSDWTPDELLDAIRKARNAGGR